MVIKTNDLTKIIRYTENINPSAFLDRNSFECSFLEAISNMDLTDSVSRESFGIIINSLLNSKISLEEIKKYFDDNKLIISDNILDNFNSTVYFPIINFQETVLWDYLSSNNIKLVSSQTEKNLMESLETICESLDNNIGTIPDVDFTNCIAKPDWSYTTGSVKDEKDKIYAKILSAFTGEYTSEIGKLLKTYLLKNKIDLTFSNRYFIDDPDVEYLMTKTLTGEIFLTRVSDIQYGLSEYVYNIGDVILENNKNYMSSGASKYEKYINLLESDEIPEGIFIEAFTKYETEVLNISPTTEEDIALLKFYLLLCDFAGVSSTNVNYNTVNTTLTNIINDLKDIKNKIEGVNKKDE